MKKIILALSLVLGFTLAAKAQGTVKGKVTDEAGEALIGVNILEKGTNKGTVTDINGGYSLQYGAATSTLLFSFTGYASQEIKIAGQNTIDVVMAEDAMSLKGVEIVGSRSLNRTVTETPVAIDVIPISEIANSVGQLDLNQLLQFAAPSFNSNRQSGSDGADHVDPATLRGLGPDQTLVLVNGKRRHQSSLVNIYGTRGRGNTGTDLNTIPTAAIERIEILRDGAAAQYGSDAIAGVINIVLKNSTDEFSGNINTGVYSQGDGQSVQANYNYGAKIGDKGFINLTTDITSRGRTNRKPTAEDPSAIYREYVGDAKANNFSTFFNMGLPMKSGAEVYAFGGYNYRHGDAYAWTRTADSDRNIPAIYPNGFNPQIVSNINDRSLSAGVRGEIKGWKADFNNTFGSNKFHYTVDKTLNASLLAASPTRFDAGGFSLSQNTTSLSFTKFFDKALKGTNVAFGLENRIDNYGIFAGEEASWRNYGVVDSVIGGVVVPKDMLGKAGGSQGFPGFQPRNELSEYRSNLGAYLDAEFDFTDKFLVAVAARYEHYSDFGSTLNGKIATRLEVSPQFALRASGSTGFRAPSLPQIYFNSLYTDFVGGNATDKFIAKNNSNITRALGIPSLKQETAVNASFGFTLTPIKALTITVDGYLVDIKNRVVLTGTFSDDDDKIGAELKALGVGGAQFFTNAVDTKTYGLDVIATYTKEFSGNSRFRASFAGNFNKMELGTITTSDKLKGKEDTYFGTREQRFLLASAPPSKLNLTLDYRVNKFNVNLRFVRFGKITLEDWIGEDDVYAARFTTDLAAGYDFNKNISLTVGGSNLLNAYPSKQDTETETGGNYDAVQMGFNGTYLFSRLAFKF